MRRRPWVAFGLGPLGAVLAAAAAWFLMPAPQYSATAILHVDSVQPRLVLRTAEANVDLTTFQRTQTTLIKSLPVLNEALQAATPKRPIGQLPVVVKVAEREDPAEWLARELQVDFVAEIIRISFSSDDPKTPATLVNAVTDAYIEEIVQRGRRCAARAAQHARGGSTTSYQETLRDSRQKLRDLAESLGSNDQEAVSKVQQMALGRQEDLEKELRQYQAELRRLTAEAQILRARQQAPAAPPASEAAITEAIRRDPEVAGLSEQIAAKGRALARAGQIYRSPNADPEVQGLGREVEALRRTLAERVAALRPQVVRRADGGGPRPGRRRAGGAGAADRRPDEPPGRAVRAGHGPEPPASRSWAATRSRPRRSRTRSCTRTTPPSRSAPEMENLRVELKAEPRVRLTQHAEAPRLRPEGGRIKRAGGAAVGTLALILLGLTLAEYRARRVDSVADISRGLGLSIVGTLPAVSAGVRRRPIEPRRRAGAGRADHPDRIGRRDAGDGPPRRADRGAAGPDGHQRRRRRGQDLHGGPPGGQPGPRRPPDGADRLRPAPPGRPSPLRARRWRRGSARSSAQELDADAALRPTALDGLWILPAGRCDDAALAALARAAIRPILDRLRAEFEFVVVDSSPVLPVADTMQVAQDVDAVVLSVLRDVSRLPQVQAAYHAPGRAGRPDPGGRRHRDAQRIVLLLLPLLNRPARMRLLEVEGAAPGRAPRRVVPDPSGAVPARQGGPDPHLPHPEVAGAAVRGPPGLPGR